jgi:hypothetical protein
MWSPNNNSRKQKDDSFKRREYWKFDEVSSKMREPVITLYAKKVVAHAATNGRSCCQVFVKELVDGAAAIAPFMKITCDDINNKVHAIKAQRE